MHPLRALALLTLCIATALPLSIALAGSGGASTSSKPTKPTKPTKPANLSPADPEHKAIIAAVELYFQGHATGDSAFFLKAFHPEAKLFWVKDGALTQKTSADFAAGASGKPAPDEAKRIRRIVSLDHAGDAAMAKVELLYPDVAFVDYLSLLKIDGRWQIVNKIFHRSAPPAAVPSRP